MLGYRHITGPGAAAGERLWRTLPTSPLAHPRSWPRREQAHGLAGLGMNYRESKGVSLGWVSRPPVQRGRCHQPSSLFV